jgi:hypothetical protein
MIIPPVGIAPGEVVVTVLALIGLIITLINAGEAMRDLMLGLTNVGGELIPVVAWNNVRNELLMITILSVYLVVGLVGALTPPNYSPQASIDSVLSPILFIGAEMLIVVNSFANRHDRLVLRRNPLKQLTTPIPTPIPAPIPAPPPAAAYPHEGEAPKPSG